MTIKTTCIQIEFQKDKPNGGRIAWKRDIEQSPCVEAQGISMTIKTTYIQTDIQKDKTNSGQTV